MGRGRSQGGKVEEHIRREREKGSRTEVKERKERESQREGGGQTGER